MEKKLLLAAALSLAVLLLWEKLVPKPATPLANPVRAAAAAPTKAPEVAPSPEPPHALPAPVAASAESLMTLDDGLVRATFSNRGAAMTSLLRRRHTDEKKRPLELIRALPPPAPKPFSLEFETDADLTRKAAEALFAVERVSDREVRFTYADEKAAITKQIRLAGGYLFDDVKVSVTGPAFTLFAGSGLLNPTGEEQAS